MNKREKEAQEKLAKLDKQYNWVTVTTIWKGSIWHNTYIGTPLNHVQCIFLSASHTSSKTVR